MKQEYVLVTIIGLFIAAYVLEAIVQPLTIDLATPYHFINPETLSTYPFTTTVIVVRAIAVWLTPVWLLSFIQRKHGLKAALAFVMAGLSQLYVLQELATNNKILPLEWALAIAMAGLAMLPMVVLYIIRGGISSAYTSLRKDSIQEPEYIEQSAKEDASE